MAGIHITGSNDFIFEATFGDEYSEGEGYVGSIDGQQPIELIIESSSQVMFSNMSVRSTNGEANSLMVDKLNTGCRGGTFGQSA